MKPVMSSRRPGKIAGFKMTEFEYRDLCDNYQGLCLGCGETQDGVEPDAEKYECEACGKESVYGTEQIMMLGGIRITEEAEG